MNTETGQIKNLDEMTPAEWQYPLWVPVSDRVAETVKLGQQQLRLKRKAAKAARRKSRPR